MGLVVSLRNLQARGFLVRVKSRGPFSGMLFTFSD